MSAELGHFALILALAVTLVQILAPAYARWRLAPVADTLAIKAVQVQFALMLFAFACLGASFVQYDFSVAYVAANSHTDTPLIYRLTAIWGAHEGSMLLWVLMLSGWAFAVSFLGGHLPLELRAQVLGVLGAVTLGFLLFMLLTSNPFDRLFPVPAEGRDLNPLLQDPGMIIHPPMLYMGYVGFSVAFAFAIAALMNGRLDAQWVRWTRPWTTAAWAFLTLGITLGSWWAYHELGWGGWWFWDPVENASFMPWLLGTALIHSMAVSEKRDTLKSWTVLLAILAFALSLLGTFLVRSGVLVSVHAFASDPARGVFILGFLALVIGGSLGLFAWRANLLSSAVEMRLVSREGLLLFNNLFLLVAAFAVLLGTLYPLALDALKLGKISVGPPYFNAVFIPLTAPLAVFVGFAAAMPWKRGSAEVLRRLRSPALLAIAAGFLLPLFYPSYSMPAALGSALALWTLCAAAQEILLRGNWFAIPRAVWGMSLAHLGLGLFTLGVTIVSCYSSERDLRLAPGASATLAGYAFTLETVESLQGPNYSAERGRIVVKRDRHGFILQPEKRHYPAQNSVMTEAAVHHNLLRDIYVALGERYDNGDWGLRLYYRPMMRLVWLGGLLAFLGALLAIADRRYRKA